MFRKLDYPLSLACLIPIFAMLPFIQNMGMPNVADGLIHLLRQVAFDRALRDGALVPRWGADLYGGFGYPLDVFAPPLLAYSVEALHLLGLTLAHALKLCVLLTLELYSVGMFLFMRPKVGAHGALIAATLNVYAPFRLREALVTGGNYPQFLALSLFPLILWAFDALLTTQARKYISVSALCYGALILSHLFHALIFTPIIAGYVLLRLLHTRAAWRVWGMAFLAGVGGLLLSAFFWLPALVEQPLVRATAEAFQQQSDFQQRFLTPARLFALPLPLDPNEANADVPLSLGLPHIIAGVWGIASVSWLWARRRFAAAHLTAWFLCGVGGSAIFLQLPQATFLWHTIPILPIAEYPWRFMGISAFALAALGGYSVLWLAERDKHGLWATCIITLTIGCAFPYTLAPRGFWDLPSPTPQDVWAYEQATGAYGLTTLNEYLPQTVSAIPADLPAPLSQTKLDTQTLAAQSVRTLSSTPHTERHALILLAATQVRFRIFNYSGWVAYVDSNPVPISTLRDGTISLAVPAGAHQVELRFETTTARRLSEWVSLLMLATLLGIAIKQRRDTVTTRSDDFNRSSAVTEVTPTNIQLKWMVGALLLLGIIKVGVIDAQGGLRATRDLSPRAVFGEQLALLDAETAEPSVARGGELHARFYWRATQALSNDYHVIAQLIAADGRSVAGTDKQHPGDPIVQGETPTSQLPFGKYVRDEHTLKIPMHIEAGHYELQVGWYDSKTGKRLKLPSGATLFTVSMLEVK